MLTSVEVRRKWVLSVEDWAEIRRLYRAERMPIKVIARVLGCSKNTVKKALAADGPPAYRRQPQGSVVDVVEPRIRELLRACPTMPATVIGERIEWPYSIRTLSARVAELRPVYFAAGPVVAHHLSGRGDRAVRFLVPADQAAGRVRANPYPDAAAGADHDHRLCPLGVSAAGADPGAEDLYAGLNRPGFGGGIDPTEGWSHVSTEEVSA
jgi:hypothetical protein